MQTGTFRLNGANDGTYSETGSAGKDKIGTYDETSQWIEGNLACLIVVDGDTSQSTLERLEGWSAHKWGLTAKLPTSHPYKNSKPVK
jgi:hypothetical protein